VCILEQAEDALCLSVLLGLVRTEATAGDGDLGTALTAAFETFDAMRRPRTQWLVNSSRRVCDLYHQAEWADQTRWTKAETCFEEIRDRSYKIWRFDADIMVQQTGAEFKKRLLENRNGSKKDVDEKCGYLL
jgi:salicylate hydroxylase